MSGRRLTDRSAARNLLREQDGAVRVLEMNHRIANHLQMLASMLALQVQACPDPAVADALGQVRRRILAVGRLHQQLMNQSSLDVASYLRRVCDDLGPCLALDDRAGIRVQLDVAPGEFINETVMTLGLIVSELATNAAKHAGAGKDVNINVQLGHHLGVWRLTVADDGPGFPAQMPSQNTGSGLGLVRLLSQKLKGTVAIDTVRQGASVSVFFP